MDRSKYYTPEIEEFCVGFEYELRQADKWIKDKVQTNDCFCDLLGEGIRVKHLDMEDIESLGFTFFGENNKNLVNNPVNMYHNNELNLMLGHYYEKEQIVIATKDPSKNETFSKTGQDPNRTGFLKIKNKTELIKLLKQLDINYGI